VHEWLALEDVAAVRRPAGKAGVRLVARHLRRQAGIVVRGRRNQIPRHYMNRESPTSRSIL
jgi:hypothetical protein